jgi:hypothetical protein
MRGMRTTRQQMFKPLKIILNFPTTASQRNFFICFSDFCRSLRDLFVDRGLFGRRCDVSYQDHVTLFYSSGSMGQKSTVLNQ